MVVGFSYKMTKISQFRLTNLPKGLIVNITGGEDLTLFEVEKSVSKIRN